MSWNIQWIAMVLQLGVLGLLQHPHCLLVKLKNTGKEPYVKFRYIALFSWWNMYISIYTQACTTSHITPNFTMPANFDFSSLLKLQFKWQIVSKLLYWLFSERYCKNWWIPTKSHHQIVYYIAKATTEDT